MREVLMEHTATQSLKLDQHVQHHDVGGIINHEKRNGVAWQDILDARFMYLYIDLTQPLWIPSVLLAILKQVLSILATAVNVCHGQGMLFNLLQIGSCHLNTYALGISERRVKIWYMLPNITLCCLSFRITKMCP